ncbi:Hypothetical predicted protein, partial [Podarcis lilfordi]
FQELESLQCMDEPEALPPQRLKRNHRRLTLIRIKQTAIFMLSVLHNAEFSTLHLKQPVSENADSRLFLDRNDENFIGVCVIDSTALQSGREMYLLL